MKQRYGFVALVVVALLTVGLSAQVVLAQTSTTAAGTNVVTLAAGQSASIPANFWCLDFGKPFPTGITGPSGTAPAKVVSVLQAAKAAGSINSNPYQTQLAVWYAADGTWHDTGNAGHALAQQLITAAGTYTATPTAATQSLGALMDKGRLKVVAQNFQAVSDNSGGLPAYHGTGNIVVTNTSSQSVSFVLDGAVFQPTNAGAQTLFAQTANTPQIVAATPTAAAPTALPPTGAAGSTGWLWVILVMGALSLFTGLRLATRRAQR